MEKAFLSAIFAASLLLAACASTRQLGEADRHKLAAVTLTGKAEKPAAMYYMGPARSTVFPPVAVMATAGAGQSEAEQFASFIAANGIDIQRIVLDEARLAFERSGKMTLLPSPDKAAATLNLAIIQYGFSIPTGFSSRLVPILRVDASLVDAANKVIWKSSDSTNPLGNPAPSRSLEELRNDPQLVEEAWRTAARAVMANIAAAL